LVSKLRIACWSASRSTATGGIPVANVQVQNETLLGQRILNRTHGRLDNLSEWRRLEVVGFLSALDAGEVQDVVQQPCQALAFADDGVEKAGLLNIIAFSHLQQFGEHANRSQRRLQLVRDAGDKLRSQIRKPRFAAHIPPEEISSDEGEHGNKANENPQRDRCGLRLVPSSAIPSGKLTCRPGRYSLRGSPPLAVSWNRGPAWRDRRSDSTI
jgi:hypothetical protein